MNREFCLAHQIYYDEECPECLDVHVMDIVSLKCYTLGILFDSNLNEVLLIEKQRPEWQKGFYNFPGGKVETDETSKECIIREFKEETNLDVTDWLYIGRIINSKNYYVDVFASIHNGKEEVQQMTDEKPEWIWFVNIPLPNNTISNLTWLVPFAKNIFLQGNNDFLTFGTFEYEFR